MTDVMMNSNQLSLTGIRSDVFTTTVASILQNKNAVQSMKSMTLFFFATKSLANRPHVQNFVALRAIFFGLLRPILSVARPRVYGAFNNP